MITHHQCLRSREIFPFFLFFCFPSPFSTNMRINRHHFFPVRKKKMSSVLTTETLLLVLQWERTKFERLEKLACVNRFWCRTLRSDQIWRAIFGSLWTRRDLSHWSGEQEWLLSQWCDPPSPTLNISHSHFNHRKFPCKILHSRSWVDVRLVGFHSFSSKIRPPSLWIKSEELTQIPRNSLSLCLVHLWHLVCQGRVPFPFPPRKFRVAVDQIESCHKTVILHVTSFSSASDERPEFLIKLKKYHNLSGFWIRVGPPVGCKSKGRRTLKWNLNDSQGTPFWRSRKKDFVFVENCRGGFLDLTGQLNSHPQERGASSEASQVLQELTRHSEGQGSQTLLQTLCSPTVQLTLFILTSPTPLGSPLLMTISRLHEGDKWVWIGLWRNNVSLLNVQRNPGPLSRVCTFWLSFRHLFLVFWSRQHEIVDRMLITLRSPSSSRNKKEQKL